jgi:hypothetical protein
MAQLTPGADSMYLETVTNDSLFWRLMAASVDRDENKNDNLTG